VETIDHVWQGYQRSPRKSTCQASRELNVPQPTVWKILRKCLALWPYRLQMLRHITPNDRVLRFEFCWNVMDRIADDETFLSKICSATKQHFIFLEKPTGITSMCEEVKILMPWLNTQGTARR
jgi:hypothetical protein